MKKKNLLILLLIPFVVALFSIATINMTFNLIDNDILYISWDYEDYEGFKLSESMYELEAVGVSDDNYPVSDGNQLIWTIRNLDSEDKNVYGEIVTEYGRTYLKTIAPGEIVITCSNRKKTVFKSMHAVIYENGAIIINGAIGNSQNNIDPINYYGSYDLEYKNGKVSKVASHINLKIKCMPESISEYVYVKDYSKDIIESFDLETGLLTVKQEAYGEGYLTLGCINDDIANDATYKFEVVKDGVNVYSYEDLMYCTNYSTDGEVVVLRKSLESLKNTFVYDSNGKIVQEKGIPAYKENNVALFGNYNLSTEKFSFANEVYSFTTTYNQEYITQWNNFAKTNKNYKPITNQVLAGIRVQKDFYGNGYTINLHNLTYPYETMQVNDNGKITEVPILGTDNLFRGPLPFYTLGDPNGLPLVTAYGQDNVGLYVDGDNITINDINIKNCDFGNTLTNLDYVGTVVDVNGDNVSINNSRISNGKNVLRVFSSVDFKLHNSMLSNARNFLLQAGSNEYIKIDSESLQTFINYYGREVNTTLKDYLQPSSSNNGDMILNDFLQYSFDEEQQQKMHTALTSIQKALNDKSLVEGKFKGTLKIEDCLFYQSGISSISLETLFNGPFLLSGSPSIVTDLFSHMSYESAPLIPLAPVEVSGLSYPIKMDICGDTKFYDYKDPLKIDLSGLINENISTLANSVSDDSGIISGILGGSEIRKITIDDIFPLRDILVSEASKLGYFHNVETEVDNQVINTKYVNIPIAFYGGGANLSEINIENLNMKDNISEKINIDLLTRYLKMEETLSLMTAMKNLMMKTVTTVTGFEPFSFIFVKEDSYLYGKTPDIDELRDNLKEETK